MEVEAYFYSTLKAQQAKQHGWPAYSGYYHHPDGRVIGSHVWNVHEPSGTRIDATSDQC